MVVVRVWNARVRVVRGGFLYRAHDDVHSLVSERRRAFIWLYGVVNGTGSRDKSRRANAQQSAFISV